MVPLCLAFVNVVLGLMGLGHGSVIQNTGASEETESSNGIFDLIEDFQPSNMLDSWMNRHILPSQTAGHHAELTEDLRGLYKTLKYHPALMERRLQVGSKVPPTTQPLLTLDSNQVLKKRSLFDAGLAVPVCPMTTEWQLLHTAKDTNNTLVEVFQPADDSNRYQWFYTTSCDYSQMEHDRGRACCRGIDTQRYTSQCIARKSFVMALIRRPGSLTFDWDYIQVDSSCNCAISRR